MFDRFLQLLVDSLEWFLPFKVVDAYEEGVVLRFGVFHRHLSPGFHWVVPLGVERVITDEVVTRVVNLNSQSLTTSDGVPVVVGGAVTMSIHNIKKALLNVRTVQQAVADSCCGVIGREVSGADWDQLTKSEFAFNLSGQCREYAKKYGITIERVQLTDLSKMRALSLHINQMNDYRGRSEEG